MKIEKKKRRRRKQLSNPPSKARLSGQVTYVTRGLAVQK